MKQLCYSYREDVIGKPEKGNAIYKTLDKNWTVQNSHAAENHLKFCVKSGYAIAPGAYEDNIKTKNKFQQGQIVLLDYDKGMDWEEAKANPFFQAHCMGAFTTSSHKDEPGLNRFRVLCAFKTPATSAEEYDGRIRGLRNYLKAEGFVEDDPAMDSAQCSFGNPNGEFIWWDTQNRLPDIAPLGVAKRETTAYQSDYTGTVDDSIQRVKTWLEYIPNDDYSIWKSVVACLKNIGQDIGDDEANLLWHEFSSKDGYDYNYYECENYWNNLEAGAAGGSFGTLKQIAEDHGFEPPVTTMEIEPVDVASLFGTTDGYQVGDIAPVKPAGIELDKDGAIAIHSGDGKSFDVTYAQKTKLQAMDVLPAVKAVVKSRGEEWRFNVINNVIEKNNEPLNDYDLDTIHLELSEEFRINFPKDTASAYKKIAKDNPYDPYQEELLKIEETVEPISIDDLATRYFEATSPLADLFVKKWLVGLVRRLMEPGTYQRGVLVLKGVQDVGKDYFIGTICGDKNRVYKVTGKTDFQNTNTILSLNASWVANLAEIESVTQKQVTGELKDWITQVSTKHTRKHREDQMESPVRYSIYGSCNQTKFLNDPTGNTRYWIVEAGRSTVIDGERLEKERDAILAMAMKLYREGYSNLLSEEEKQVNNEHNDGYVSDAAYTDELRNLLEDRTTTCLDEVWDMLDLTSAQKSQANIKNQVVLSLEQIGFTQNKNSSKIRDKGKTILQGRFYVKKGEDTIPRELLSFAQRKKAIRKPEFS